MLNIIHAFEVSTGIHVSLIDFHQIEKNHILPLTVDQWIAGVDAYNCGALIQDAFPDLAPQHREFLLTGLTPAEWDALFSEEDED